MQKYVNSNYYRQRTALKSLWYKQIRDSKLLPILSKLIQILKKKKKPQIQEILYRSKNISDGTDNIHTSQANK